MEFKLEVIQRAGMKHLSTDALSELSRNEAVHKGIDAEIPLLAVQRHACKNNIQTVCKWQDCDTITTSLKSHQLMTDETDDVKLPEISYFILA